MCDPQDVVHYLNTLGSPLDNATLQTIEALEVVVSEKKSFKVSISKNILAHVT